MIKWTSEDFDEALKENWYLLANGIFMRSGNEGYARFTSSEAVFEHVRSRAAEGSKLHQKALAYAVFLRLKS